MFIDASLMFDPAGTAITNTQTSTNTIDLGSGRDLGLGNPHTEIIVSVQQTFTAAGAATLNLQIQSSVDNVNWSTLMETSPIAVSKMVAGIYLMRTTLPADQPAQTAGIGRYLRLNYVVASGPFTAGTVESALVHDRESQVGYPSGFSANN